MGFDFHSFLVEKRVFRASGFPAASVPTQLQITHIIIRDTPSKRPCLPSSGSVQTYTSSRTVLCRRSSFRSHPSGTIASQIIAKHLQTSSMLPSTTINRQSNKNSSPNAQTHVSDTNLPGSVQNSPQLKDRPSSEILFQISSEWNDCKSDHSQALANVKHAAKHDNQPPKQQKQLPKCPDPRFGHKSTWLSAKLTPVEGPSFVGDSLSDLIRVERLQVRS